MSCDIAYRFTKSPHPQERAEAEAELKQRFLEGVKQELRTL